MLVCLKMLVIFLTCGDKYVKVVHFMPLFEAMGVGDLGWGMLRCILSLNWISRAGGCCCCVQCALCVVIPHIVVHCPVGGRTFS